MAIEESAPEQVRESLQPVGEDGFRFACHPGVPCFTECCRDLNLMLTPYDVLRLKRRLGVDSDAFLDTYTELRFDERRRLPMVYLTMSDDARRTCPFVAAEGCRVYGDRPAACRTYPLARASRVHRTHGTVLEDYFVLRESHCRGFAESRSWSVEGWIENQGLGPYHEMNNLWMEIITHPALRRGGSLNERQQQMLYLACYNLDRFRTMVLARRFLDRFQWAPGEVEAFAVSDDALLRLSFRWVRFALFHEAVLTVKPPPPGAP